MADLRLDLNTNLFGPNPAIARVDPRSLDLASYPDEAPLEAAIGDFHGLPASSVVATNGSDEALALVLRAHVGQGAKVATTTPGYDLARHAQDAGARLVRVPLKSGRLDVDALVATKAAAIVVANPNNPTGQRLATEDLEDLLAAAPGLVVADEAYIEYAGLRHSLLPRTKQHSRLAVTRSFSKAYGLAGLRVGWLAAHPDVAQAVRDLRGPHALNAYSIAVATAALDEQEWVDDVVRRTRLARADLAEGLKRAGCRVHPSDASFVLAELPVDAGLVEPRLRAAGLRVRRVDEGGHRNAIRVTAGPPGHVEQAVAAVAAALRALQDG